MDLAVGTGVLCVEEGDSVNPLSLRLFPCLELFWILAQTIILIIYSVSVKKFALMICIFFIPIQP